MDKERPDAPRSVFSVRTTWVMREGRGGKRAPAHTGSRFSYKRAEHTHFNRDILGQSTRTVHSLQIVKLELIERASTKAAKDLSSVTSLGDHLCELLFRGTEGEGRGGELGLGQVGYWWILVSRTRGLIFFFALHYYLFDLANTHF